VYPIDSTIADREQKLNEYSDAYYNGQPLVSDAEFDRLWKEHKLAREEDPSHAQWKDTILDRVGAGPMASSGFTKVKHLAPMMSLDNIFVQTEAPQLGELRKWLAKLDIGNMADKVVIVAEPKIDGLSASIIYEDGLLSRVVTRGDGDEGDDITANALAAALVPSTIIPDAPWGNIHLRGIREFRGEIYMPFGVFNDLHDVAIAAGEEPPSNPRNAAAGMIRRKDSSSLRGCGLKFMVHGIENTDLDTYSDERARAAAFGFIVPAHFEFYVDENPELDVLSTLLNRGYPTDGLVFKVDSYKLRKALGFTSRAPKWAIALKLEQEQVETICSDITVQVGRSGILTPVAELDPVTVDGSVVSRATLHNEAQVNRLGLMVGDRVVLQKAGGVIPEIVKSVTFEKIVAQAKIHGPHEPADPIARVLKARPLFSLPDYIENKCPSCGSTDIVKDGERYVCGNTAGCKAQMAARVEHMASRGCLNIMGLGTEACDAIAQRGDITHPFDILNKDLEWFASLSWVTDTGKNMSFGNARAKKAVDSFATIGKQPFSRWLAACGIHSVGENTSKEVSRIFKQPLDLVRQYMDTDGVHDVLKQIVAGADKNVGWLATYQVSHHLGPVSAGELLKFIGSPDGAFALAMMAGRDVVSDNYDPTPAPKSAGNLTGQAFAITGTMSQPRDYFKAMIEEAGGKVTDTISAKLTALVCGLGGGGKRDKAAKLGIPVWDENQLRDAAR